MNKVTLSVVAVAALLSLAGCDQSNANDVERAAQLNGAQQLLNNQPIPGIRYSQMRQNLIEIEQAESKGVQTTSFIFGNFSPDPVQTCSSIGVPIPNTASLSNPHQVVWGGSSGAGVVDQMDPNGVYAPSSSSGTFVQCVGANGQVEPVYAEGNVHAVFGAATWDYGKHAVVMTGAPSFKFTNNAGR